MQVILKNRVWNYLSEEWWVVKNDRYCFFSSKEFVYVKDNTQIVNKWLFVEKQWIPIIKLWFKWDFIPQQWIVAVFWNLMKKNTVELPYEDLQKISEWSDIPWVYWNEWNFLVVKRNNFGLFLVKQVKNYLKIKL